MNPVVWFGLVLLGVSAICFVADFFLKLGEDGGTSDGRDAAWGVDASSSLISGEASGVLGTSGDLGNASPELSFSEALKPKGRGPSWASVRREG